MQTGIYVRVSTEEQAKEGFSIRAQQEKLKGYALVKDWSIYDIYVDEGISGKNITQRPSMTRLLKDIENGYIKNVLVFKIDRLTRSTSDLVYLIKLFAEHDCAFNSLTESIDTETASGRMFLKIIGIFAEFERENLTERVRLGCERKAKEGFSVSSWIHSYGYNRDNGQKIQTINEEEATIVREIYDMYVNQNKSLSYITRVLNIRKVPTKLNVDWARKNVKNILKNCNYIGKVRYRIDDKEKYFEADGLHEPIITKELFDNAQRLLTNSPTACFTKQPKECNYYLGFLYCAKCGSRYSTHGRNVTLKDGTKKYVNAYRCENKTFGDCTSSQMSHKKVEEAFVKYISNVNDFEEVDITEIDTEKTLKTTTDITDNLNKKIKQLKDKEREVMSLYVDNKIDFDNYKNISSTVQKEISIYNDELNNLKQEKSIENVEIAKEDIILNLKENWELLTDIEKRQFLLNFVKKIVVDKEDIDNRIKSQVEIVDVEFKSFI